MSTVTYHLVPAEEFWAGDPGAPYTPAAFEREGFVHCTDGTENVIETANRHVRDDPRPYLLLVIDRAKLTAEVRYEDDSRIYPHIYGPIERDAIAGIIPLSRDADGRFLAPE